jgi:hypothetical protein
MGADWGQLTIAAILLLSNRQLALLGIAGAALSLLLVGIHNASDTVRHIVVPIGTLKKAARREPRRQVA